MSEFFAGQWDGEPFRLFGWPHLTALVVAVAFNVGLVRRFRDADGSVRARVCRVLAVVLWAQELSWHTWNLAVGRWRIATMLPLHLCSVLVWAGGLALLLQARVDEGRPASPWLRRIYEPLYFFGIGGATQALLTPDVLPFGVAHFRFYQTMLSHTLILASAVWLTFGERRRPTLASAGRALLVLAAYAGVVFAANLALGSNYLFINRKPDFATILDALPPWPGYLPVLGLVAIAIVGLLYGPWAVLDAAARRRLRIDADLA